MSCRRILTAAAVLAAFVPAAPAAADHHFMRVGEVFGGAQGNPNVQFVELQMFGPGQRFVNGTGLRFLTPTGTADGTFNFTADVANGADNATILAATPQAAAFFGVTPDLSIDPVMDRAGGKLEFVGKTAIVDRFSWGSYGGVHTGSGTPFPGGLALGLSAVRNVSGGTIPHELDAADDTGDSANDFFPTYPSPKNNAGLGTSGRQTIVERSQDGELQVEAGPGVKNDITVSGPIGSEWKITETGAPLKLGTSAESTCAHISVTEVRCANPVKVAVDVSDLDDRVTISGPLAATVSGGTGNDKLTGGGRGDDLSGDDGHDALKGNHGNDTLVGGSGNELMDGGIGADTFVGDSGIDTVTYAARTGALVIDIDNQADDGNVSDASGGRRDDVQTSVEWLTGGSGPDFLIGSSAANRMTGGKGADQVYGMGGADSLFVKGDGFADKADCGSQLDTLSYDAGLDEFPAEGPGACETATP